MLQHRNAANGGAEVEEMRKALREEEADSARLKKELDSALADLETAQVSWFMRPRFASDSREY